MQSKHLWYTIDINWQELTKKLNTAEPTGLTREQLWQQLCVIKHRQNPFQEGRYKGADFSEVKRKWLLTKEAFRGYLGWCCPLGIDMEVAIRGFNIDNGAAQKAVTDAKALHARRWQTKEGTYRIKSQLLPDVRDGRAVRENAAASSVDIVHCSHGWEGYSYMDC